MKNYHILHLTLTVIFFNVCRHHHQSLVYLGSPSKYPLPLCYAIQKQICLRQRQCKHLLNYQGNMSRNENETNSSCPACYSHTHLLAMFLLYTTLPSLSKHSYCDAITMDQEIKNVSKNPQKGLIKLLMRYSHEFQRNKSETYSSFFDGYCNTLTVE